MLKHKGVPIIGLHALAGYGKTEVAHYLQKHTGFKVAAFAAPLKKAAAAMYNIDLKYFYEGDHGIDRNLTLIKPYGMTIRAMMTNLGDAMKNQNGGDYWINLTKSLIEAEIDRYPETRGIIIEDIRYDHTGPWGKRGDEYSAVKSWGGRVIHIDAEQRIGRLEVHNRHSSEKGITRVDGDIVIDNNGELEELEPLVEELVKTMGWYPL